ncbi:MAG: TVP38/TMEM64 family protein [archaeon]
MRGFNLRNIPKKELIINAVVILIILTLIGVLLFYIQRTFESPGAAAEQIRNLGPLGPLVVITLIILEVIVAPVPGALLYVAAGYAFGTLWGTIFSYVGQIIGTTIAFFISRRFGRPIVERLVKKEKLDYYDCFFQQGGKIVLWVAYLIPIFPADTVTFVTGMSNMDWKKFIIIPVIAFIPNLFLHNYFGATLYQSGIGQKTIIFGLGLVFLLLISLIVFFFTRKRFTKKC